MANDNQTLDSITSDHDTQMKLIIAKTTDKIFDNIKEAADFTVWCVREALKKMGAEITDKTPADVVDKIMAEKKIEIQKFETIDKHSGVFCYQDDELQFFISDMEKKTGDIIFHKPKWVVRTNVTI